MPPSWWGSSLLSQPRQRTGSETRNSSSRSWTLDPRRTATGSVSSPSCFLRALGPTGISEVAGPRSFIGLESEDALFDSVAAEIPETLRSVTMVADVVPVCHTSTSHSAGGW